MSEARDEAVGGLYGLTRWPVEMQVRLWLHGRRGAPCGRLLESDDDVDAAARGVFERLYGLVAKAILLETVKRATERVDMVRDQVCQVALTQRSGGCRAL